MTTTSKKKDTAYEVSRKVEKIAHALNARRKKGWVATREYVNQLYDIAESLKMRHFK
jgi:hypothetical protein